MKRNSVFRFKQFDCSHGRGSMKIGVDAVLVGAWAPVMDASSILDVGTGSGVIALMCAQRNMKARITAIDIDADSITEAADNFASSPWSDRLHAMEISYDRMDEHNRFDLIVSNPPYFNSGVVDPDTPRMRARHQDELCPLTLLEKGKALLTPGGRIAMIIPADQRFQLVEEAKILGLTLSRGTLVRGHDDAPIKRVLLEFRFYRENGRGVDPARLPVLTLEVRPGVPTEEHRALCGSFYLKY